MADRTFAVGDIHGDIEALDKILGMLPELDADDTLVFLGDYVDRGPDSAGVIKRLRALPEQTPAKVVCLRGNHEDAWLKVLDDPDGWPGFVMPKGNGCRECMASFVTLDEDADYFETLFTGAFWPPDVVEWMRQLPYWYEDDRALYVHAGLLKDGDRWLHPSEVDDPTKLLWVRSKEFFLEYSERIVVCGHTVTNTLPDELSQYTPEDPDDLFWAGGSVYIIDTGAGKDGFLTALELPVGHIYESRRA